MHPCRSYLSDRCMVAIFLGISHHSIDVIRVFGSNHHAACIAHLMDLMAHQVHYSQDHNIGNQVNMASKNPPSFQSHEMKLYPNICSNNQDGCNRYHRKRVELMILSLSSWKLAELFGANRKKESIDSTLFPPNC